jgi:hypothetical protein
MKKIQSITNVPESLEEAQKRRIYFYLWNMGLRVVLFVAAVLIPIIWLQVVLIILSLFLPMIAVIGANEADRPMPVNRREDPTLFLGAKNASGE